MKTQYVFLPFVAILVVGGYVFLTFFAEGSGMTYSENNDTVLLHNSPQQFIYRISEDAQHPHAMDLVMTGTVEGKAVLKWGWDTTTFYRIDTIEQLFSLNYTGIDWYNDSCIVRYEPLTPTSGDMDIRCGIYAGKK